MIPEMEELGVGSGVGSDYAAAGGFDLASAPVQPVPQRFPFGSGGGFSPGAMPEIRVANQTGRRIFRARVRKRRRHCRDRSRLRI